MSIDFFMMFVYFFIVFENIFKISFCFAFFCYFSFMKEK